MPITAAGELAVEPVVAAGERAQPDRQARRDDLDDAAERVAVLLGGLDLGDHRLLGGLVERADRAGVDRGAGRPACGGGPS